MDIDLDDDIDGTAAAKDILDIRDLPIVFLTGHTEEEYVSRVENITSYGIVQKYCGEFFLVQAIKMAYRLFDAHARMKREIEEREKAEKSSAEQEALYRNLMENSIDAVYLLSEEGKVLNVNEAACTMLSYSRDELLSKSIDDIDPNYPSRSFIEFWKSKPEGTSILFDSQHIRKDGELIDVEVNGIFFILNGEKYLFGVARDVSEWNQYKNALEEQEKKFRSIADYTYDWEDWIGTNGELIWVNPAVERITGYSPDECYAMTDYPFSLIHSDEIDISYENIQKGITYETSHAHREFRIICKDGSLKWISVCRQPIYDEDGNSLGIRSSMRDITEKKRTEEALRESEKRNRTILQALPDLMFIQNRDGTYVDYHAPEQSDALYTKPEEFLGRKDPDVLPEDVARVKLERFAWALDTGELQLCEYELMMGGLRRYFEARISPYEEDRVLCIVREITERKSAEEELRRTKERYQALVDNSPFGILEVDENGRINFLNDNTARALGLNKQEAVGKNIEELLPAKTIEPRKTYTLKTLREGALQEIEEEHDGEILRHVFVPMFYGEKPSVQIITQDVTQQRKAEERTKESEHRYRLLFENANESIVIFQDGRTKLFNDKTLEITEYSEEEFEDLSIDDLVHPDDREMLIEKHEQRLTGTISNEPYEYRIITKAGKTKWLRMKPARIVWEDRPASLGMIEDITALKETEEELQKALREKDYLMKELNHRVKNNLYMISSLVSLKDSSLGEAVDLSDIKHQINAIEIIHEKLSDMEDIGSVNIREYILDILNRMFADYSTLEVHLQAQIGDFSLPTRKAVPLGLITNEIATNALKYGFNNTSENVFSISLEQATSGNELVYTLSNSGPPFPEEVDFDNPDSLGMRLIQALVTQLDGTVELQKAPSPRFTIRFPV
jgi:PAS domain S-box-containing protein